MDELLKSEGLSSVLLSHSATIVADAARAALDDIRKKILSGVMVDVDESKIVSLVLDKLDSFLRPSLKRVINASGTILHTNLGRAVLAKEAVEALITAATGPVNLEFDLERGERGRREAHVEGLLLRLTGAEAATVVNNNAGAVLLVLNTLALNREVVVSRGELIEIGGSFRLPEIMDRSGAIMKEVGTTNRTRIEDYASAVTGSTALLFKAHRSNFEIKGFCEDVSLKELAALGGERGVPVVEDLGSGSLVDLSAYGIKREPVAGDSIRAGADIVTFSGDKLLGGPQAGIIIGKRELIDRINSNPMKRALRVDKLTIAALEATLRLYLEPEKLPNRLPVLMHLSRDIKETEAMALKAKELLERRLGSGYTVAVEEETSEAGSGSLPGFALPTKVLSITHPEKRPEQIFRGFLDSDPPILGRIRRDRFLLDLRTVERPEDVVPERPGKYL